MDLMDAEEGHGPMPVARPPPVPEDDLDAAMAAFDEAAAAPSEPAPAEPMATEPAAAAPAAAEPSSAPAAAMDADAVPPTQDVAPTQLVPPTQDMECAPTQPVPPSQACDLPDESALEFNSQPSQLTADDGEAEFQF